MNPGRRFLKASYSPHLLTFSAVNFALFWVIIVSQESFAALRETLSSLTAKDGLLALLAPVVTLVLSGLVSPESKARLVFWRWHHPLPGCRAFSNYLHADDRIDRKRLRTIWGEFPQDPAAQNSLWYRMYTQVQDDITVAQAHRFWLFSRDLSSYAAIFLVVFAPAMLFVPIDATTKAAYIAFLAGQYVLMVLAARNYGGRFVCNVLTQHAHTSSARLV